MRSTHNLKRLLTIGYKVDGVDLEKRATSRLTKVLEQSQNNRAQSIVEYLINYAWALVIIGIVIIVLYLYLSVPSKAVSNTCAFVNGAYCSDIILGTNPSTHTTSIALFLTNLQQYPIVGPTIVVHLDNQNTSAYTCSPNFVPPGGSVVCVISLNTNDQVGTLLSGTLYLNATYCGLAVSAYDAQQNCSTGIEQTYVGQFAGHLQPLVSTQATLTLTASNYTQNANGNIDPLSANVSLLGYPLSGAAVNFTTNNTDYSVFPSTTLTNANGIALSGVAGKTGGAVVVTVNYAGLSKSVVIRFTK